MLKSFFLIMFGVLALSPLVIPAQESQAAFVPAAPNTGSVVVAVATSTPVVVTKPLAVVTPAPTAALVAAKEVAVPVVPTPGDSPTEPPTGPVKLLIPSISLSDNIINVGLTANGEMAVPPGNTQEVGWYDGGTVPGNVGSAVIDAHVFAAFSKLQNIKIGSDIYVTTSSGQKLHFVVSDMQTYALADVPADVLFNRADQARLNLITCAGKLTADRTTYDHRLVVYATLVTD